MSPTFLVKIHIIRLTSLSFLFKIYLTRLMSPSFLVKIYLVVSFLISLILERSSIQAIANNEPANTPEIQECREIYQTLQTKHKKIVLQWIPGHCDIAGKGPSINYVTL